MQLYLSPTSPFSRLTLITAIIANHTQLKLNFVNPWDNPESLTTHNPFSQIPTLISDDNHTLYQTSLICQFLHPDAFVNNANNQANLNLFAYAYSLIEQIVKAFSLKHFAPKTQPEHPFIERAQQSIIRALHSAPELQANSNDYAQIILACAFDYLSLRQPTLTAHLSASNQQALHAIQQRAILSLTHNQSLQNRPQTPSELGFNEAKDWQV
ncbi:glutathione S-transferase N-terminal domain-containing protein [Rappaport israeli]|uniref:glutathione S-transferase N-terminal domain-containing protein n=1 Tax=Rappaport israeli TaxID=1839807 RepID=UPI000931DCE7|nr:glutathione S-transferase family protein [Rappaport israeli]